MKLISQKSHLRRRQECCDQLQDIGITLVRRRSRAYQQGARVARQG